MTFAQIQALASTKRQPGKYWGVVAHPNAHFDEFVAFVLLLLFGEAMWPGISQAHFIMLSDGDQVTEQQLLDLGLVPVGMCKGRYDEHLRVEYTSSARLVQKDLGLLNGLKLPDGKLDQILIATIDRLVDYAVMVDRNPVRDIHAAPNDVKMRWTTWLEFIDGKASALPAVIRPDASDLPADRDIAWQMAIDRTVGSTLEDLKLYMQNDYLFFSALNDLATKDQMKWYIFTPPGSNVEIRMALIGPECESRHAVAAACYAGAHIVFKRSKLGHVGIFPHKRDDGLWAYVEEPALDPTQASPQPADVDETLEFYGDEKQLKRRSRIRFHLDTDEIMREFRRLELGFNGDERELTDEDLSKEHLEGSHFVGVGKSGMILWGSQDAGQGSPACPLKNSMLLGIIKRKLLVDVIEQKQMVAKQGKPGAEKTEETPAERPVSLADQPVSRNVM